MTDLTREQHRTRAMATIGMSIGVSFMIAVIVGPLIAGSFGVAAIFIVTSLLAIIGIAITIWLVPTPLHQASAQPDVVAAPALLKKALMDNELVRLNTGIFTLHFILMSTFVVLPLMLGDVLNLSHSEHWKLYLPLFLFSFIAMVPFIIIAERGHKMKQVFVFAVSQLLLSLLALAYFGHQFWGLIIACFAFFMAFNLLEATLPSLISKRAFAGGKGTAMGVYSTSQFLGAFLGGTMGGLAIQYWGAFGGFILSAALVFIWLVVAVGMEKPKYLKGLVLHYGDSFDSQTIADTLRQLSGVVDVMVVKTDRQAYLKIDEQLFDEQSLASYRQQ
jgi:predicted MFS family arabinose efflux permease